MEKTVTKARVSYEVGYIDPFVFGSRVLIINYWSILNVYPKFQLEIWTVTAWIFSDSLVNTISFPIQISKSIISQIKANAVEQIHENYGKNSFAK